MKHSFDLWDKYEFCCIYNFVVDIFPYYLKLKPDENVKSFYEFLLRTLEDFIEGRCPEDNMIVFAIDYRTENEYHYIDFNMESECITVSEGGSVYDSNVGSDSFTLWSYSIWDDGDDGGDLELNIDTAIEFINMGAQIHIEQPEEYDNSIYED